MNINSVIWGMSVIVALSGCATIQKPMVQNPSAVNSTHGFVYLSQLNTDMGYSSGVKIRSLSNGKVYVLQADSLSPRGVGLWVPAGDYELPDMLSKESKGYPPIVVSAGGMTDLGGLVVFDIGGYEKVMLPVHNQQTADNAAGAKLINSSYLGSQDLKSWSPEAIPSPIPVKFKPTDLGIVGDLLQAYSLEVNKPSSNKPLREMKNIRTFYKAAVSGLPPVTSEGKYDDLGNLYFGADLGQIRIRSKSGDWSSMDTGVFAPITTLHVGVDGLVAIAKGGGIYREKQKVWKKVAQLPGNLTSFDIQKTELGWIVAAGNIEVKNPKTSPLDGSEGGLIRFPSLSKVVIFEVGNDFNVIRPVKNLEFDDVVLYSPLSGAYYDGKYFLNVVDDLLLYDVRRKDWKSIKPSHSLTRFYLDKKTKMLTAYLSMGVFSKLSFSTDLGSTWTSLERPGLLVQDVAFKTPERGYALKMEQSLFSSTIQLLKYQMAENNWKVVSQSSPGLCRATISDEAKEMFFCVSGNGSILRFAEEKLVPEFILN
ncbi:hypothetical protein HNO92_003182 [Chromobacterium alkanivorans]|uniref:hypothetical protein n=1 Tax=Chromobacterium alkanivorans TaxID=1071719 RepID=UPI00216952B2|nr:hypothetical protein [Chromobacterium alkanivorans]MCS3805677.1 hypothetical protein [Chromobacterium alkanivorans]MCS3820093.1 hypothetical protein [Chromobacterium alkanivorans]MCS3874850.1 hypothetical protein [Chromobacterium alkanivorans]